MNGYTQSIWIEGNDIIRILEDRGFIVKSTREILRTELKMSRKDMYERYPFLKSPKKRYLYQFKFAYLPEEKNNVIWKLINNLDYRLNARKNGRCYIHPNSKYSWSSNDSELDLWDYLADVRCRKIVKEEFNKKILNGEYK